jgi:hypothetical protein
MFKIEYLKLDFGTLTSYILDITYYALKK